MFVEFLDYMRSYRYTTSPARPIKFTFCFYISQFNFLNLLIKQDGVKNFENIIQFYKTGDSQTFH